MRDLDLLEDDEDGLEEAAEIHLEETDEPCRECGDEGCHLYPSHTADPQSGEPDPDVPLCGGCGPSHEAFYEAVRAEEDEKEEDEDEKAAA